MLIPLSYSIRSLFVRRATTIATALGIGLVVFVLASSLMLSSGIRRTLVSTGTKDRALVLRKGSDAELVSSIENPTAGLILAAPGIKKDGSGAPMAAAELVVVIALDKLGTDGQVSNVQVRGVQPMSYRLRTNLKVVEGRPAQPGADEAVIGKSLRGRFAGLDLGQTFELKKNRKMTVVGVFDDGGSAFDSEVWVGVDTLRSTFGREGLYSSVLAQLESPGAFDVFKAQVEHDKQLGLEALREVTYYEKQSEGTSVFVTAMGILVALFFSIGAMIGAMITMYAAVSQRSREIGTLQALGFSRFAVLMSFLFEAVVLATAGGVIGALASLAMGFVEISMMNFATWQEVTFSFNPDPAIIAGSVLAGGIMGLIGGFFPAG
ncbi:MAG TPA: ABC transporter permease, partial [Polyangiaceae bacterium]|nr:ABC transporter permease [Polyangiaceae bacterium]